MASNKWLKWLKQIVRWSLLIVTLLYILTGFGITEFRTVDSITFGLLDKAQAFTIHTNLEIPFLTLLAFHMLFSPITRIYYGLKRRYTG